MMPYEESPYPCGRMPEASQPITQPMTLPCGQLYMPNPYMEYPMMPSMYGMEDVEPMDIYSGAINRDPPPVVSNNPAVTTITLFKELTGYPNYGNPSGNADILYTGNRGVWTFDLPQFFFAPGNLNGQLVIRAVLDDHTNVPVNRYSARITVNDVVVHRGQVPLPHGSPAGQRFNNWRDLTFNVRNLRRNNRVEIVNTSSTGDNDWIGFDWMEMRLTQR